jgi:hypothetical protein
MEKFIVYVREVHVQGYRVDAKDAKEAVAKVENGEGDLLDSHFEYSHTLDSETWTAEKENEDEHTGA